MYYFVESVALFLSDVVVEQYSLFLLNQTHIKNLSKVYLDYIKYSLTFELYYQKKNIDKGRSLVARVEIYIEKNYESIELSQSNYIYFLLTRFCIIDRQYEKALDFINKWSRINLIDYYIIYTPILFNHLLKTELYRPLEIRSRCVLQSFKKT